MLSNQLESFQMNLKSQSNINFQAVLVLGATGRTGKEVIHELANHPSCPDIHAFCHDATKLSDAEYDCCSSVIEGSARHAIDIEEALLNTNSNWVVLCVGNGDDLSPNNIRTFASQNLVRILQKPRFQHVHVLAVSMTRSYRCIGTRNRIKYHCVLEDHKGQEIALHELGKRTIIARSTLFNKKEKLASQEQMLVTSGASLDSSISSSSSESDDISSTSSSSTLSSSSLRSSLSWLSPTRIQRKTFGRKSKGDAALNDTHMITFEENEHPTSVTTKRRDLAIWIVQQICDVSTYEYQRAFNSCKIVNVTSFEGLS
jgi:NAD(P)H-binding